MIILNYIKETIVIYFLVYLYDIIGSINVFLTSSTILFIGGSLLITMINQAGMYYEKHPTPEIPRRKLRNRLIWIFAFGVFLAIVNTLIPSKEGIKLLAAVYVGDQIVSNKDVQRIGGKSIDLLEKFIDDTSKKLDPPVLPKKP